MISHEFFLFSTVDFILIIIFTVIFIILYLLYDQNENEARMNQLYIIYDYDLK